MPKPADEGAALLPGGAGTSRLFQQLPLRHQILVPLLLTVSITLNIICLVPNTPFLLLDVDAPIDAFIRPGNYGLGATLELLKEHNMWLLYILIVGFSICWPPIKIAITTFLLAARLKRSTREVVLAWLGHLGRWSLMDVYFAMVLIMIVWQQGVSVTLGPVTLINSNVATTPMYGLYLFHAAIICSMAAVTILQELNATLDQPAAAAAKAATTDGARPRPLLSAAGVRGYVTVLLALITLVLQLCAVCLPVFTIVGIVRDDLTIPLRPYTHTLSSSIYETAPLFATDMTIFLLITPALTMVFIIGVLLVPVRPGRWCYATIRYLSEWSMLDVYVAAFVIYLSQQSELIDLQLTGATYLLFFYIPFMMAAVIVGEGAVRSAVEKAELSSRGKGMAAAPPASSVTYKV